MVHSYPVDSSIRHINVLEQKAMELVLYTYCKNKYFLHIRVIFDNITNINHVKNMKEWLVGPGGWVGGGGCEVLGGS